jgi:hypothetical protein
MASSFRLGLVIVALLAGSLAFACGGGGNGDDDDDGEQPTATAEVEDQDADEDEDAGEDDGGDAGAEAFGDIPIPAGASETSSGSWSGSIPFAVPNADVDPEAFTAIEFKQYDVDDSPEDVIAFFQDELDGWDEVFVFSGGAAGEEGGFGVWTRDDGRAAVWVAASIVDDATELLVILGTQE